MSIKILTDSTSYINENICEELDIQKVSLYVTFGDDSFKETEISNQDFYRRMEKEGIPISSQPPLGELLIQMKSILEAGHDLIAVFLSSKMSGTFDSAKILLEIFEEDYPNSNIKFIDSKSNSMQLGFSAIAGARLAQKGASFEEVVKEVKDTIVRSRFIFIPDSLEYLKKGGRIGSAGALVGRVLKITPILTVKDAETSIFKTVRTKGKAKTTMIQKAIEDHNLYGIKELAIHHIDALEEAEALRDELTKVLDVEMHIANIGPVIGLHVGPGSLGLAYYTEKEIID